MASFAAVRRRAVPRPAPYPALRLRATRSAAAFVALIALSVLAGWALDVATLRSAIPGAVEMKANTAFGLLLCALALGFLSGEPTPATERTAQLLAATLALLGVATLSQYVFGFDLRIDEALFLDNGSAFNDARGRMSPYTAVAFAATGMGLAALPRPEFRPLVWTGAALAGAIGLLSAIGYAWNVAEIVTDRVLPPVAINTAIALMMITGGMLVACSARDSQTRAARTAHLASLEVKVLIGFAAAVALLLAAGAFTYRSSLAFTQALEFVAKTQAVNAVLARLESRLAESELAQRQFLLTQQTAHHVAYAAAAAEALGEQRKLLELVARQPEKLRHAEALGSAIAQRTRLFDGQIVGSDTRGLESLRELIAKPAASDDAIRTQLTALYANEAVLDASRSGVARVETLTFASLLLTLGIAAGLMTFLFRGIRREVQVRREVERFDKTRHDVLRVFATSSTRSEALGRALDETAALDPFVRASFYVPEVIGKRLVCESSRGEGEAPPSTVPLEDKPLLAAMQSALLPDDRTDAVVHAVYYRDRLLGMLHLSACAPLSEREHDFVRRLADELAIALSHFDQFTELRALSAQLAANNAVLSRQADELVRASRMKSEFLATMSHELRTPLNAIIGFAEVLRDELAGTITAEQREYVDDIYDSGEHLLALINDILDLTKVEAGKMDLALEDVDVVALLQNSLAMVKGAAHARRLRLDVDVPADLPVAELDARRLKQIVYNLLSNAVKFTPDGGTVTLRARCVVEDDDSVLEITVADTGIGIAPEDQVRLFQPFVQIDSSLQKRFQGTGLGLAMVKQLAELHGGSVSLRSEPARGSAFTVRLPCGRGARRERPIAEVADAVLQRDAA